MFGFGQPERRAAPAFQEWLSRFMVRTATLGATYVLVDPKITLTDQSFAFVMNSGGFSGDTKGLVVGAILIGGYNSIREFWLGTSKSGQEQSQSMSRIAEATPTVAAAAVAAASAAPTPVEIVSGAGVEDPLKTQEQPK